MIEEYWRAGYHVQGAKPVEVEQYAKTKKDAEIKAAAAAKSVCESLDQLGLPNSVTLWTKRWTSQRIEKSDKLDEFLELRVGADRG